MPSRQAVIVCLVGLAFGTAAAAKNASSESAAVLLWVLFLLIGILGRDER